MAASLSNICSLRIAISQRREQSIQCSNFSRRSTAAGKLFVDSFSVKPALASCGNAISFLGYHPSSIALVNSFDDKLGEKSLLRAGEGGIGGNDDGNDSGGNGRGNGDSGDSEPDEDSDENKNRTESLVAVAAIGRTLESLPSDFAEAIMTGKVTSEVVYRFASLENSPVFSWLMKFSGFKERLLADDLFLTKLAIEVGVGVCTKTAAEYERRRGNFWKEIDFVVEDIIMAVIADFMLVWLPAPTIALSGPVGKSAGHITRFLSALPDNAFQVPLRGTHFSLLQRTAAIVRNGVKLLGVGTMSSLIGAGLTNGLQAMRGVAADELPGVEEAKVPILATSLAYGVYMAVSSNLRYQVLAGVVEQRVLEPWLHDKKLALAVFSFVARTGNTFLGSLLWVDYARWVGVQSSH